MAEKSVCKHEHTEYVNDSEGTPRDPIRIEGVWCLDCESWIDTELFNFMEG